MKKSLNCLKNLTDTGLEKKVRYRTELAFFGQFHRLNEAQNLAAPQLKIWKYKILDKINSKLLFVKKNLLTFSLNDVEQKKIVIVLLKYKKI